MNTSMSLSEQNIKNMYIMKKKLKVEKDLVLILPYLTLIVKMYLNL